MKMQKDPKTDIVVKNVISFPWTVNDITSLFLIETFKIKNNTVSLVNISTDNNYFSEKYLIPEFLDIVEDVTGNLTRESYLLDIYCSTE